MEFIIEQEYKIEYYLPHRSHSDFLYLIADSFEDAIKTFNLRFNGMDANIISINKIHDVVRKSTKTIEINV